ncbi:MAG: hypothetical protein IPJ19_06530 [Planctomycetes bacterium]|nr:hypothetical protein [Planctomycetota bacterium]
MLEIALALSALLGPGTPATPAAGAPSQDAHPPTALPAGALEHACDVAFLPAHGDAPAGFDFVAPVRDGRMRGSFAVGACGVSFAASSGGVHTMRFVGASPAAQAWPQDERLLRTSDLRGNDPSRWVSADPSFGSVRYTDVWPGIDAIHRGEGAQLRYDFELAPHADPSAIRLAFDDACELRIDAEGALVIETELGSLRQRAPHLFQTLEGKERDVEGSFRLLGEHEVGFEVGAYDADAQLVIDPVITYGWLVGSTDGQERPVDVKVDELGFIYVLARTQGGGSLWNQGTLVGPTGNDDLFLMLIDGQTNQIVSRMTFGGSQNDTPVAMQVVSFGEVVVAGETLSTDLPVASPSGMPYQPTNLGGLDAFAARLSV